jgi:RNA polymerase sigma-70 factor (ECF subfamily)
VGGATPLIVLKQSKGRFLLEGGGAVCNDGRRLASPTSATIWMPEPPMNTTSLSLLDRLKQASPDSADWLKLQDIYLPLIRGWLTRVADLRDEAEDLSQEVLVVLLSELPAFERQRDGSFRAWLRQITLNRLWKFQRTRRKTPRTEGGCGADQLLAQLADPNSDLVRQWDQDHDRHVVHKLLALVKEDFEPNTWRAFTLFALEGRPAARVAEEVGMKESAVMQAKSRILKRLREEAGGLLD